MILGLKSTLTDQTLVSVLKGESTALNIQGDLKKYKINVTIQGIYKSLRELIRDGVILKQGKKYFINNDWRNDVRRLFARREDKVLNSGSEVKYIFKKIENADVFWKNIFTDIKNEIGQFPVFHFLPHQFWILIPERKQSELDYYNNLNQKGIFGYTLIGNKTVFDNKIKNILSSKYHQFHVDGRTSFNNRNYISVLGDYVITTKLSAALANEIDEIYSQSKSEQELALGVEAAFNKKNGIQIIIKNSPERAKKLRKIIAKNFYIPKELKKNFDIF